MKARRCIGGGIALAACAAAALVLAARRGSALATPALVAAVAAAAAALAALELALVLRDLARARSLGLAGRAALLLGVVLVAGGGLANWAWSLQGYVVLAEGEAVPLFRGSHLEGFDAGPLSDPREMALTLRLDEVSIRAGDGGLRPESRIVLAAAGGVDAPMTVAPGRAGAAGSLRFHQGAFGFAPRIVLLRGERAVFDRAVPFTTRRDGADGVAFEGELRIEAEDLDVRGAMSADGLDADVRGHPRLGLEVRRAGALLGRGELAPGRFAELSDGSRIGFAGFSRWSEIDVSRRPYPEVMVAGAALAVLGGASTLLARGRRRA